MSSDCSIICGLPDPPWEAAGRDLPPAPQARAVRKILSRCQWRDWSNRFRCQLRPGATSRILPGPIIAAGFARPPSALVKGLRLGLAAIGVGGVVLLLVMA